MRTIAIMMGLKMTNNLGVTMKPNEIRAGLMLAEKRINAIAKTLQISASAIHHVINGQRNNPRIRQAIAEAIGKPVAKIWPEQPASKEAA